MASERTIIKQIEKTVRGKYSDWQIGITDYPAQRKAQLGYPLSWLQWQADADQAARNVERHFLQKGMHRAGAVPKRAKFVYMFLVDNPTK
jgi:hypothetical protein